MRRLASLALVLFTAGSSACDSDPEPPPVPAPSGRFQLTTDLEVPAGALLPQVGYDALEELHGLRDDPGETMFDLLDQAGVPYLEDLEDALPSVLQERLEGWIGDAILEATRRDVLDPLFATLDRVLADVDVVSELDSDGLSATHRVLALRFTDGVVIETSALSGAPVVEATTSVELRDGRLAIGAHAFGVPYGRYAWAAIEAELPGGSLLGALGLAVDCPFVARQVASRGVLGVTVGHEAQIELLCESGLQLVAAQAEARVRGLAWDALAFEQGDAALVDTDGDTEIDALADGLWDATIDVGQGARRVGATFTGTR